MSLDLDIKLSKTLRLNDLIIACGEEIMKLTETALIITEQLPQYATAEEAGIWAGVTVQGKNNINFLLAAGVALAIAKACDTDIIDERTVWSSKRENTYNEFREEIKGRIRVNKQVNQFFEKMLTFFPFAEKLYWEHIDEYKERLDTCVMEDIFMPGVLELLREEKDTELLKSLFDYFEEVSKSEVDCLRNIFSVTVLEMFGSDRVLWAKVQKYMGPKTRMLQGRVDIGGYSHAD